MKCSRVQLSDRTSSNTQRFAKSREDTPRHYCQRRLADSSHDEREWLKRYTPERYHLTTGDSNESEGDSRPLTPATLSETPEIFDIKTPKNVFRPAFLSVTNIDLPPTVKTSQDSNTWLKRKAKYKTVPKHCSAHMHRMFVKNIEDKGVSRTSSRASTEYDRSAFEEYLCQLVLPDDSSEISLFETGSQTRFVNQEYVEEEVFNNNNDSYFINKNAEKQKRCMTAGKSVRSANNKSKDLTKTSGKGEEKICSTNNNTQKIVKIDIPGTYKREKRKSITLSRVPSPETIQVIRIDVITGYPVDNDSILSEITDQVINSEETSELNNTSNCNGHDESDEKRSKSVCHTWKTSYVGSNNKTNSKIDGLKSPFSPLNCKSLNLSSRF